MAIVSSTTGILIENWCNLRYSQSPKILRYSKGIVESEWKSEISIWSEFRMLNTCVRRLARGVRGCLGWTWNAGRRPGGCVVSAPASQNPRRTERVNTWRFTCIYHKVIYTHIPPARKIACFILYSGGSCFINLTQ